MATSIKSTIFLRLIILLEIIYFPLLSFPAPQLPESDLSWKNVVVDGKKTAVFCLYKDSHGIMWLGTNSGLFFFDGVSTHPVGETELFGLQIYSVLEDDNKLYLGSNNGLLIYDYTVGKVEFCNVPTQKEIRTLLLFVSPLDWRIKWSR